ncbi:MAG TPA: cytochrome P450 [Pseudonocardia sp.]|nr:cytochrome P450 [Pseudonocardia sp.]
MPQFARDYHADYHLDDAELSARWDEVIPDLHAKCPVARSEQGEGYWVVNSYEDVNRCAKDWQTFSSADGFMVNRPEGMPYFFPAETDPPLQRALRATLDPFLRSNRMAELQPAVRAYANELIDGFIGDGEVELVSRFAELLPQYVFSTLIAGMNPADMPYLVECFSFVAPDAERTAGFASGMVKIEEYLSARREQPSRGDIVDALLAFEYEGYGWMDRVGTMSQLTIGGVGTTGFGFSGGLHHLATHLEDRKLLVEEPNRIAKAVEEFLRFYLGVPNMARRVTGDVEVGGVQMKKGDRVLLSFGAASRDPNVCEDPDTLDISRRAVKHLAFGSGVHRCIGQPLARMVLNVGYTEFLKRIPDFDVAPGFTPSYKTGATRQMVELPLRFGSAAAGSVAPGQKASR